MPSNPMTKSDASRIQSTQAKNNQDTGKNSFASRAQSTGDKHAYAAQQGQQQCQQQGQHGQQGQQGQHGQQGGNHRNLF